MSNVKRISALVCTAVLLAMPALSALADSWNTGVYASLNGGAVMIGDAKDVKSDIVGNAAKLSSLPTLGKDWKFDLGIGGAAGIGYDFGVIRLEGEVTYLSNGISITRTRNGVDLDEEIKDRFTLLGATGNAWFDVDTGTPWLLYFGGGFGTAKLGIHLFDIAKELGNPDYTFSAWSLAFQGGAGVGYHLGDVVVIDVSYRLLGAIEPELVKSGTIYQSDFTWPLKPETLLAHRVGIGLRIIFL